MLQLSLWSGDLLFLVCLLVCMLLSRGREGEGGGGENSISKVLEGQWDPGGLPLFGHD